MDAWFGYYLRCWEDGVVGDDDDDDDDGCIRIFNNTMLLGEWCDVMCTVGDASDHPKTHTHTHTHTYYPTTYHTPITTNYMVRSVPYFSNFVLWRPRTHGRWMILYGVKAILSCHALLATFHVLRNNMTWVYTFVAIRFITLLSNVNMSCIRKSSRKDNIALPVVVGYMMCEEEGKRGWWVCWDHVYRHTGYDTWCDIWHDDISLHGMNVGIRKKRQMYSIGKMLKWIVNLL